MTNFIELNIESPVSSLSMIDNESHFKPFLSDSIHFISERIDIPETMRYCQECGIADEIVPIAYNGYCKHCAELHQYDNY
jgi:hypothetical protein